MQQDIEQAVDDALSAIRFLKAPASVTFLEQASHAIAACFQSGHKILVAGNGGSLCDAMHFAEELTGVFRIKRKALPAMALTDPGHMSCTANDLGYDEIFSRSIEAFGLPGDLFVALTTSGNSSNLLKALMTAKSRGLKTISFLGKTGGKMQGLSDYEWVVSGFKYSDRIQEAHMTGLHIIVEMVEKLLFDPIHTSVSNLALVT